MKKIILATLFGTLFAPIASQAAEGDKGYLTTKEGTVVKSNFGLCWNTSSTKIPNEECGDKIQKEEVKPTKAVKPLLPRRINEPYIINTVGTTKVIVVTKVLFKFDSHELSAEGKAIIDEQVVAAKPYSIEIKGYTDPIGNVKYNQKLSEKRANSVKEYLVSKGIEDKIITVKGLGETELVCTEKTKACNAQNRRTEIKAEVDKK